MLDAAAVAKKWQTRLAGSGDAYKAGIQATKVNPMEKAAQAKDKYVQKTMEAVSSGKYEAGLARVSKQEWQRVSAEKGAGRLTSGAQDAQPKMQRFLSEFLPYAEQVSDQIASMPSTTPEDNDARMLANVRAMRQFRRTGR